jgi:hypothetical protein
MEVDNMALTDVRNLVVEFSGRADLDATPWTTLHMFINRGQKLLDRLCGEGKLKARYFVDIVQGQIIASFPNCRAIKEVWVSGADGRTKLEKADIKLIRDLYDEDPATLDQGTPDYYAPAVLRAIGNSATKPETLTPSGYNQHWALDDVLSSSWYTYNGVMWMPPADAAYTLEVWGLFDSIPLDSTNVTGSFWTEVEPLMLAYAALYYMEISYRNTEGAKDWLAAITGDTTEIVKDVIEEEISDLDDMKG